MIIKILALLIIIVMSMFVVTLYRVGKDVSNWINGR